MAPTYTTMQAARLAQVSTATVRNYTRDSRLKPHLSPNATTTGDKPREFTADDVRLLRFIGERTAAGATLDAVTAELEHGALDAYAWQPPINGPKRRKTALGDSQDDAEPQNASESTTTALQVLSDFARALQVQFDVARERERELSAQVVEAERRAAIAEAELAALRRERRSFWARLFGR